MQYLLLIYEDEKRFEAEFNPAELEEYGAFGEKHGAVIQGSNALNPSNTAKTVRVREGKKLITDGPFAETKEQLGGYYLVEAETMEDAASIAAGIPGARFGGVEVRPVMKFS